MNPGARAYQHAGLVRIGGALDTAALRTALEALVDRHEALRSSIVVRDGEPLQRVHERVPLPLEELDLREAGSAAFARTVRSRARVRIDLAEAPWVRWTLMRLADERWALLCSSTTSPTTAGPSTCSRASSARSTAARHRRRPRCRSATSRSGRPPTPRRSTPSSCTGPRCSTLDPDLLRLPFDRPRAARESFDGGLVRHRLGAATAGAVSALAEEEGATLFQACLAAFAVQLARYDGRDDVQVGTGVANRGDPGVAGTLGMLVNTIALRVDLSGEPSAREAIRRVRDAVIDGLSHADVPFDRVVDRLAPPRDPSRSPLVQTLFSFDDAPRGPLEWPGVEARVVHALPDGTANADLNVIAAPLADGSVSFVWEHVDAFSAATAARIAAHHARLLEAFVADPDAPALALPLGDPASAATPARHDPSAALPRVVARRPARARGAAGDDLRRAVGARGRAGRRAAGGRRGARRPRRPRPAALRGSDRRPPRGRARGRRHGGPRPRPPGGAAARDPRGGRRARGDRRATSRPARPRPIRATSTAQGRATRRSSTSPPARPASRRASIVTHENILRLVQDCAFADLGPGTVTLHAASPAFDATTLEVWGPLVNGGTVAPLAGRPDPDAVAAAVAEHGVTTLWLTAGLFHALVDQRSDGARARGARARRRRRRLAGPRRARARRRSPPAGALERLRPDRGHDVTTTWTLRAARHRRRVPLPIGLPMPGSALHVMDGAARRCPTASRASCGSAAPGSRAATGTGPELTAERFVAGPGGPLLPHAATCRPAAGRRRARVPSAARTSQVKIRGYRVEPAEIEAILREHPAVADAVVMAHGLPTAADRRLAAYIVARPGASAPSPAALRGHVAERLPAAMVPVAWGAGCPRCR